MLRNVDTAAQVEGVLARSGVRPTRQRAIVLEELAKEPNDITALRLHERLRARGSDVSLATVYRTLAVLSDHGVVDTLTHHAGELCYRVCSEQHHHHLTCERCHRVVELDDCDLEAWVDRSAKRHGFSATGHQVEIAGVCADCRR
jgi:Fur family transcriptional regulator, ferric uptake regulator